MIVTLNGVVSEKLASMIVIDVNGVGYGLIVTTSDYGRANTGKTAKFYIYEHLRENIHDLYGFSDRDSQALFEQLLSVKNIGPKAAMAVVDIAAPAIIRANIANGDIKFLQRAKGIGQRAAEQIVVELRDKVEVPVGDAAEAIVGRSGIGGAARVDEAVQALVALGYTEADAQAALHNVDSDLPLENRIKIALRGK